MNKSQWMVTIGLAASMQLAAVSARAEIAVSANDGKQNLINHVVSVPVPLEQDSISVIEVGAHPRVLATLPAPASVTGPPTSVAITPDESLALVTAARKLGPGSPPTLVPDDVMSVVTLNDKQSRVSATLQTGSGPSGVSINPQGSLALVANKVEGTISVFKIAKGVVTPVGKVSLGADSSPSHPAFYDNGRRAAVTRGGDGSLGLLVVDGDKVWVRAQTVPLGRGTNGLDIAGPRRYGVAVVGNSISLIDLAPDVPVVVDKAQVRPTAESVKISPDGHYVAVNSHNGSGGLPTDPGYNAKAMLQIFRIEGGKLVKVTEAQSGAWGQGVVWSKNSKHLLVQATMDKRIDAYAFDGKSLKITGSVAMPTAPVGFRTAER
jgi:DNA-binding beta-propeller fold protein YncE